MNALKEFMMEQRRYPNGWPIVKIVGVGGAGTNIINDLYQYDISAELISINTDWRQLSSKKADRKILIGMREARGLGCGGDIIKGANAAKESKAQIIEALTGADMVLFVGGLGRGTATGALPEVARYAKDVGALTVAFLTVPFFMLRSDRDKAQHAIGILDDLIDTTILVDNNKLQELHKEITLLDSFGVMNEIIYNSVQSFIELIRENEIIEIDYANLKSVLEKGGFGTVGITHVAKGESTESVLEKALSQNLSFFDSSNAATALIKVSGDDTLTLDKVNAIANQVKKYTADNAEVLITAKRDDSLAGALKVTVILGGMKLEDLVFSKTFKSVSESL